MDQQKQLKNMPYGKIISWVIAIPVIFIVVLGIGIYRFGWQGQFVSTTQSIVPYPVAIVNYRLVTLADFNERFAAYKQAVEFNQDFDFSDPDNLQILSDQKASLIDRMIDLKLTQALAEDKGLNVTGEDIQSELELAASQSGIPVADFNIVLSNVYGWDEQNFIKQVLVPQLYEKKLKLYLSSDKELNSEAHARA